MPSIVAAGALATSAGGGTTPALPAGLAVDDILILQIMSAPGSEVPSISNSAGGTWAAVGPFSGGASNSATVRGTWIWSRYNGTQTAPTVGATSTVQLARIAAVRGCIATGDPYLQAVDATIFAVTSTTIPTVTTTVADCLILDCIVGNGPDADGTGVYAGFTNGALTGSANVFNDSSATGPGGSLAMQAATMASAGATGTTAVTHASLNTACKKIALLPAAGAGLSGALVVTLDAITLVASLGIDEVSAGTATIALGAVGLAATGWLPVASNMAKPWTIHLELEELP